MAAVVRTGEQVSVGREGAVLAPTPAKLEWLREALVGAGLDHAFAVDGSVMEVAVPIALLADAPESVTVYADVNDQVFLPNDYSLYAYTVSVPQGPITIGGITLDGDLSDWTAEDRLDVPINGVDGYEVYGRFEGDTYLVALNSAISIGGQTTLWLNTDGDATTGHQIFGFAGGAELTHNPARGSSASGP